MSSGRELAAGETPNLAEATEMAHGPFPDSDRHQRQAGDPQFEPTGACGPSRCRAGCRQHHGVPEDRGNSRVAVLVSALPAFLLLPETSRTHGSRADGHHGGLRLSASHLVQFQRLWSYSLQDEIVPMPGK